MIVPRSSPEHRAPACLALLVGLIAGCATPGAQVAPDRYASRQLSSGAPTEAESGPSWFDAGRKAAVERGADREDARNLILFVGDGMGTSTVTAARILYGQRAGSAGEEAQLAFERFPALALAKTYNTDAQTPDSAGTMTAMMSGAKTRMGVIGVDQRVVRRRCEDVDAGRLPSLLARANAVGMATGVVTTTRLTHATPAATYAHSPERDWEANRLLPLAARAAGCTGIAEQLLAAIDQGRLDLALGGGRGMFVAAAAAAGATATDLRSEDPLAGLKAKRPDLHLPTDRPTLEALPADSAPVLGLFAEDHLAYEHHRTSRGLDQPSLAAMTRFAVQRLQASGRPYALVIEAGRIDHAHHEGRAQLALIDTLALSEAVAMADRLTSADDTLIVVTADHGHTLTITGYPARGNPVLGLVRGSDGALSRDLHGRPYTTLSYANGPGATVALDDLASLDTSDTAFRQPALVPLESETHSGEDVAVYARGPGSSAVRGVIEQHVVFHLLAQAQPMLRSAMQEQSAVERSGPMPARPLRASESP